MVAKRDFTDRFLRAIKPAQAGKRVIIYDAQVPGFGIRVTERSTADNKGSFVLVSRFPGSPNPTPRTIGEYPAMTLAKARQIAREWREDIRQGIDPKVKEADRRREEQRRRADSFAAVFAAFAEDHLSTLRTGRVVKRIVENHACPHWADRPVSQIRRADVIELIRLIRKDAPIGANRLLAYLKTFFSWAVDQDLIDASPAASVKKPSKENQRDRVLSDAEIRAIWLACGGAGPFGRAIRLMLATGQRRAEVSRMRWSEVDFKTTIWSLPRERTKADRAHVVPLTDLALSIIEECPRLGEFVFATGRSSSLGKQSVPISGWGKAKKRVDKAAAKIAPEMAEWHLHDLRRTSATNLAKLGTDRVVISKILNHGEGGVTGVYDRHRYDHEKKQALDAWAARLVAIVNTGGASNVISISAVRR